jgi:minor extracellular serine protease Vpr
MRSPMRKIHLLLFVLYGVASLSGVEVAPDRRKVEPLALATGEPAMVAAQAKAMEKQGRQTADFGVFVHLTSGNRAFPDKIRALGGEAAQIHDRLYSGTIPADATRYVSRWPEVAYIEAAKMARPMLDLSRPAVSADNVQAGTGLPSAYNGAGTYVGIVDSGLSRNHLDFFVDGDPSQPRVAYWYHDNVTAGVDTEWHGTHVAGIAAGNGFLSGGRFIGMAPGASLLVAKTIFTTVDIQRAVEDLLNFAGTTTTPVAINLSLGVTTGPHDGTSLFEEAIDSLAAKSGHRVIITAAAGNERTDREHFQITLPLFGSVPIPLSLETSGSYIDVWADGADRYTVRATLGSESLVAVDNSAPSSRSISISNRKDEPPNGATHITVFFTASSATSATISLERTRNGGSGKVDSYIDIQDGSFSPATATEGGTITEPANAQNVIAVGSFNTKNFNPNTGASSPAPQDISSFSSLGPTRDGRDKPDLAAPGVVLYSARSLDPYGGPHPTPSSVPGYDNYVILEGTSMSAPHVAGIASLVWQSNPFLTSAQMRERLRRTATPILPSPNTTWGFGKANALQAVSAAVASITAPAAETPGNTVALNSENSSGAFGNPLSYTWAFSSRPTGSAASLSSPADASTSFVPDIPGDYRVSLTVSQSSPAGTAEATVHVNNVPLAAIAGPANDNVGIPVAFSGAGSTDPDSQPLTLRWVLVSRPSGSQASLLPTGSDNATMTPDFPGNYEVGLRADDGLDNSVLVTKTLTTTGVAPPSTGGGGGGGCSIGNGTRAEDGPSSLAALLLILLPLFVLPARKRGRSAHRCSGA